MLKGIAAASFVVATTVALGAVADGTGPSTFQYTCSNIRFEYANNRASVQGGRARGDVPAHGRNSRRVDAHAPGHQQSERVLQRAMGESSFQKSCGNIQITVSGLQVMLTAMCRTMSGTSLAASLPLNGISNRNGVLTP
jgi:hypothetical protein